MKFNQVLTGLFVILFFVILGEIGYFLLTNQRQTAQTVVTPTAGLSPINETTETPLITPSSNIKQNFERHSAYFKELVDLAQNRILKTLIINIELETKIIKAETVKREIPLPGASTVYHLAAILILDNNGKEIEYLFSENSLLKLNVYDIDSNGEETKIEFADLKPGDKIKLRLTQNFMTDANNVLIEGTIKRYPSLTNQ